MNVKVTIRSNPTKPQTYSLEQVIASKVDGSDYERGELESMKVTIENQTNILAKIVARLSLSNEELTEWFGNWNEELEQLP